MVLLRLQPLVLQLLALHQLRAVQGQQLPLLQRFLLQLPQLHP